MKDLLIKVLCKYKIYGKPEYRSETHYVRKNNINCIDDENTLHTIDGNAYDDVQNLEEILKAFND